MNFLDRYSDQKNIVYHDYLINLEICSKPVGSFYPQERLWNTGNRFVDLIKARVGKLVTRIWIILISIFWPNRVDNCSLNYSFWYKL